MKRLCLAASLAVLLVSGCEVVVPSGSAGSAEIPDVQFLRPVRDSETGTWIAAWVEPEGYDGTTD